MNSKTILGVSVAAVFAVSLLTTSAFAGGLGFLDVDDFSVKSSDTKLKKAVIETFGKIPKKGEGGPFGYGVVTDNHPSSIIVATTHPGVLDSELQYGKINSPRWHNHYVQLATGAGPCTEAGVNPDGIYVANISYESPGKVLVHRDKISIWNVPAGGVQDFRLGLAPNVATSLDVGIPQNAVVSFTLSLEGSGPYGPEFVCVDNVQVFTP